MSRIRLQERISGAAKRVNGEAEVTWNSFPLFRCQAEAQAQTIVSGVFWRTGTGPALLVTYVMSFYSTHSLIEGNV